MKHIIVGTAGHVDHGKTTLVKAMTGHDTDRLKEEKERGISIELGFAPLTLPNGVQVGLVDVPGHERFIKNMLAGAGGMDLVLLIIAADEGIMPQTREHLDIIQLLKIPRGIVVITKTDLVDPEWVDLIQEEVSEALKGTILATAPIIPVSATTGEGIAILLDVLQNEVAAAEERKGSGPFRLPVDRVFSITGFGTVVTGTLTAGEIKVGDAAELMPAGLPTKIRSVQVHGTKVERAIAGQRVAVNVAGLELQQIERGNVVTTPGILQQSYRLDAEFHLLPGAEKKVTNRQRMRLHLGTTEALCRVLLLDREEMEPGETAIVQLLVEESVVGAKHDRFVIRTYSPMHTVGGGTIIDPNPARHRRFRPEILEALATKLQGTPAELLLQILVKTTDKLVTVAEALNLANLTGQDGQDAVSELLAENQVVVFKAENKEYIVAGEVFSHWLDQVRKSLQEYHQTYQLRAGMPKEELRSKYFSAIPNKLFNSLLLFWEQNNQIKVREQAVQAPDFIPQLPAKIQNQVSAIITQIQEGWWQPPGWTELVEKSGLPLEWQDEVLYFLLSRGDLVKLADDIYYSREAIQAAKDKVIELLAERKQISLAEVRDLLGSSRKYILPLLEYLDRTKITRRVGDQRVRA